MQINSSTIRFFRIIWGENTSAYIAEQTNIYAQQKQRKDWVNTNTLEIDSFIGMLTVMGFGRLPSLRDNWRHNSILDVPGNSSSMQRNCSLWILSNLHLNNNADLPSRDLPSFEKLNKARPLLHRLRENNQNTYIPHKQLAVDEAMILFKSGSLLKEIIVTNTSQLD